MATSFVEYNNYGFWAHDAFVEAMQLCLINEIENTNYEIEHKWLTKFKHDLSIECLPMIYGGMSMRLDEYIVTNERKKILFLLIDRIVDSINLTDNYIQGRNLFNFRLRALEIVKEGGEIKFKSKIDFNKTLNDSSWLDSTIHDFKERYSFSFLLLKKLLDGELKTLASSPMDYWNY